MRLISQGADNLAGIAVEGLHPSDQAGASASSVDVADVTLYYGGANGFERSDRVEVVQFKYSPLQKEAPFKASHAKETVAKFAEAYLDYRTRYGFTNVEQKLRFQLITNRSIWPPFCAAVDDIANGRPCKGQIADQASQFAVASGLSGETLQLFARKLKVTGAAGTLSDSKRSLSVLMADWSATNDALASARLGALREMVRDKAGYAGSGRNVIRDTDVLAALSLSDRDALLPCPSSLPDIGPLVAREQLPAALDIIPSLTKPLLIHAAGGVGKTVFMQTLQERLQDTHETIFFDCFGGGAYRAIEDSRHLPKNGLVHIANSFACRGLCDPILPGTNELDTLLKSFRRRLDQSVATLSRSAPGRGLVLFLDAIDNAAEQAHDRGEPSFPTLLLEAFSGTPLPGFTIIASSRSHRIPIQAKVYHNFELSAFSPRETASYLNDRLDNVSEIELAVAQARSGGNGRILEYLVAGGRGLLEASETNKKLELTELIRDRVERALAQAVRQGYKAQDTDAFLAGLAILPPPVPMAEYAKAHDMELPAIESFVADLWPLLERTKYGVMFRDEPTETFIRESYAGRAEPLQKLSQNLFAMQDQSVYAARALPGLLYKVGDADGLFNLAFDTRYPALIQSPMGKRHIRLARLKAAVRFAAMRGDHNQLVHLLLELSTIASVNMRGDEFILASPDLVVAARDADALRRLFELRSAWQGARHARLAIANTLSGDLDEAARHFVRTEDWLRHHYEHKNDNDPHRPGPDRLDIAAGPFFLAQQNRGNEALQYLRRWKEWYAFEVAERLLGLIEQKRLATQSSTPMSGLLNALSNDVACTTAALAFLELTGAKRRALVARLARSLRRRRKLEFNEWAYRSHEPMMQDGLRKAAAVAASLGLYDEAATIAKRTGQKPPSVWSFRDHFADQFVFPFVFDVALKAVLLGRDAAAKDLMPAELVPVCKGMKRDLPVEDFRSRLKARLEQRRVIQQSPGDDPNAITSEKHKEVTDFLDRRLQSLVDLTQSLIALLKAPAGRVDAPFKAFLTAWASARDRPDYYATQGPFFQSLGRQMALFCIWVRGDLNASSVDAFLARLGAQEHVSAQTHISVVALLAKRKRLRTLAGEQALKAKANIELEHDIGAKAVLYADLARAILPASADEAASYFRAGLDQIDAIGSGDYEFTNELLLYAASLSGSELSEQDLHALTNICELNLSDEPEKFPWCVFGTAMSRTAGQRGLAKLSRWDDRSKVQLTYTLLPYLDALLADDKIDGESALALNRLAPPAELYHCNTETLAKTISDKGNTNAQALIAELISQYQENRGGTFGGSHVLIESATNVLGKRSLELRRLVEANRRFTELRQEITDRENNRSVGGALVNRTKRRVHAAEFRKIIGRTIPTDEQSLEQGVADVEKLDQSRGASAYLASVRAKVAYEERSSYLLAVSRLRSLNLFAKLHELQQCRVSWRRSSAALQDTYNALTVPMLRLHADDLVSYNRLSSYQLSEIAALSGVSLSLLAVELARMYAEQDSSVPATVWLALATHVVDRVNTGEGQGALKRLLHSEAARLSSAVADGEYREGAYPPETVDMAAALVWRMLGSPRAEDRWHAAHAVRRLAKFDKWSTVDSLVEFLDRTDAGSFQAPELAFYYMHARLWLLISLARIAQDYPKAIVRYAGRLLAIAENKYGPHPLLRHFASSALLSCAAAHEAVIPAPKEAFLREINKSPFPRRPEKAKRGAFNAPPARDRRKAKNEFALEYDFEKHDVRPLSDVFGLPQSDVAQRVGEIAHEVDASIATMYDSGGRERPDRQSWGMTSRFHTYGEYLGWHALQTAAGEYLQKYAVTDDSFYDDPWGDWLSRYLLTMPGGLWLADGLDDIPLDAAVNLLRRENDELEIIGEKGTLLRLAMLDRGVRDHITVAGSWYSMDGVRVSISSALVKSGDSTRVANELIAEEPMHVWLPQYDEDSEDYPHIRGEKTDCVPWVLIPSGEGRLDADDPLGSPHAAHRPRFARVIRDDFGLKRKDPFGRVWSNARGAIIARAHAWGRPDKYGDKPGLSGTRLMCSRRLLKQILAKYRSDLVVLISLQRYQRSHGIESESRFTHTIAVARVRQSLALSYHKGPVNHHFISKY